LASSLKIEETKKNRNGQEKKNLSKQKQKRLKSLDTPLLGGLELIGNLMA